MFDSTGPIMFYDQLREKLAAMQEEDRELQAQTLRDFEAARQTQSQGAKPVPRPPSSAPPLSPVATPTAAEEKAPAAAEAQSTQTPAAVAAADVESTIARSGSS